MSNPTGMIPYANTGPYRMTGTPAGCHFIMHTPRQVSQALHQGEILAGLAPVGDLLWLGDTVTPLGAFGIAASGPVKSVLLFSNAPLESLDAGSRLYLSNQSSSSVRLLTILLKERSSESSMPQLVATPTEADCFLTLGDKALLASHTSDKPVVIDLAEQWVAFFHLPFVFARWVIRADASESCRQAMHHWLQAFAEDEAEYVALSAPVEAERLGLTAAEMLDYLNGMRRVLLDQDLKGQALFLEHLKKHSLDGPPETLIEAYKNG